MVDPFYTRAHRINPKRALRHQYQQEIKRLSRESNIRSINPHHSSACENGFRSCRPLWSVMRNYPAAPPSENQRPRPYRITSSEDEPLHSSCANAPVHIGISMASIQSCGRKASAAASNREWQVSGTGTDGWAGVLRTKENRSPGTRSSA